MKKYPVFARITAVFNNTMVQALAVPLFVALALSAIPFLWNVDSCLKQHVDKTKMLISPSPEIIVLTIDDTDNQLYKESAGGSLFGKEPFRWRNVHAGVITKLSSLPKPPKGIGLDITFHTRTTEYDNHLIDAITSAHERGINVVLAMKTTREKPLNKHHWVYRLYKEGIVQFGSVYADLYDDGMVKNYVTKNILYYADKGREMIPSLAVALFSKDFDLSTLSSEVAVKYAKEKFVTFNYRDVIDDERFDKIKERLINKHILIGAENPADQVGLPYIPPGQPKCGKQYTYGVFYHANALNYLFSRGEIQEIAGLGKVFLLFVFALLLNGVYLLLKKYRLLLKLAALLFIAALLNAVAYYSPYILPLATINMGIVITCGIAILPELYLNSIAGKLNTLQKGYAYMNKELYKQKKNSLNKPCHNLLEASEFILNLNKIFVETEGHTWFEEIPYQRLQALALLEADFTLSNKRNDCIKNADQVKEEFVGTRIRRMRNYLAHANLNHRVIELSMSHLSYYSGTHNYFNLRPNGVYLMQIGLFMELTDYLMECSNRFGVQ